MGSAINIPPLLMDALLNDEDIKAYIVPAIDALSDRSDRGDFSVWYEMFTRIQDALGITVMKRLTENQKQILKGLAGPHGHTILKAIEARR